MKKNFQSLDERIDQWIAYPGIPQEVFASRKLILSGLTFNFVGGLVLLFLAWRWDLAELACFLLVMNSLMVVSILGIYFRWGDHQDMFFFIEVWSVLFAFFITVYLGGIPYSGGFIFLGVTAIMTSLLLKDFRRVRFIFLLFLASVILAGILQVVLGVVPVLSPRQNLIYFMLLAVGFSGFMLQFNRVLWAQRLETKRRRIRHLEELDEVKTRFYTNISHEFRTPLTVILGMAQLIRENPAENYLEGTRLIERNGRRLLRLVNQMLELSKLESGALSMQYVRANAILQLKYTLESFHSLAEEKGIKLDFYSVEDEVMMDLDREKMEQIIGNLLSNALKFTPAGGRVRLQAGVAEASQSPLALIPGLERCLQVRVEDTGIGIAPEHLGRVFDRFFQADPSAARSGEGSGIGLALTREYMRMMEGVIGVESKEGEGTTFTLFLPIRQEANPLEEMIPAVPPQPEVENPGSGADQENDREKPLLLIIEDNRDVIRYLETILWGAYRLSVAFDGKEGIDLALALVPDIIISDVMMPKKDGFEVCQTLKSDFRTNHIPVILLTAKADKASRISGLQTGADAYLAKPFDRQELFTELDKLLRLRAVLRRKYSGRSLQAVTGQQPEGLNERFLFEMNRLMEKHYADETFGIRDLCQKMGISRTQLHRKMIALTGRSAVYFIRSFRIQKALTLLQNSRMTVAEVAYAVGFKDPNYFSRVFTGEFGESPRGARSSKSGSVLEH